MMRKLKFILAAACIALAGTTEAQSLKEKMQAKLDKANAKLEKAAQGKPKYAQYDFVDDSGISGTYYVNVPVIERENTIGFEFNKEENGEIVNKLNVKMGGKSYGDRPNSMKCVLKEKYQTKFDIKYFYMVDKDIMALANNRDEFIFMEINPNVYTFTQEGKVISVLAKDSSLFSDFDVETAQVLYDQNMSKINSANAEKETAIWMKNELYAKNIDKIVFAPEDYQLLKRGYGNKPPMVNGKDFATVLDMAGNMNYMAFFKVPPAIKYPGQEVNYVFEMGGKSTNRIECRSKSAAWGKMVKRIETSDFDYRQHSPRSLRTYNQFHSQHVQDYAFIQLLHLNKDNFKVGEKYSLTVKMYSNRDGENGEIIAEGVVSLLFSEQANLLFNGDPDKPEKIAVWDQFEEFLDE